MDVTEEVAKARLSFIVKQKTAYEMRISDWSSDVCSSDLLRVGSWSLAELDSHGDGIREERAWSYAGRIIMNQSPRLNWQRRRARRRRRSEERRVGKE